MFVKIGYGFDQLHRQSQTEVNEKNHTSYLPLLILGCAENLDEEITYKQEISWIECKPSAVIKTKYFSGKINFILNLTGSGEGCDVRTIHTLYFKDKDGFNIYTHRILRSGWVDVITTNDGYSYSYQSSETLDKELYKKISNARVFTKGS